MLMVLLAVIIAACTRERETPLTDSITPPALDGTETTVDEPDVVILPASGTDTPSPEPTGTPEVVHETVSYAVQPGDTVSTIAERFGIASQTLREMNLLTTDALVPGQVLRVPNSPQSQEAAAGTPMPTAGPFTYIVQDGDTLYSIALAFDVAANDIVAANTLSNPNALFTGQSIIIPNYQPGATTAAETATQTFNYVIEAGDTLFSIAQQFGVAAAAIIEANALSSPDNLLEGQTLQIPGVQGPATSQGTERQSGTHVVADGETLLIIAQKYGISVNALISANNLSNPDLLTAGQTLLIPGLSAADVAAANRVIHTVSEGEGLYGIANQYNVSAEALMEANNITNPNLITVGQELIIPTSP